MKRCWDSNADDRPSATEVKELIVIFKNSYTRRPEIEYLTEIGIEKEQHDEIKAQFELAEENRKGYTYSSPENNQNNNHPVHGNIDNNDNNNVDDNNNNDVSDPSGVGEAFELAIVDNENNNLNEEQ